MKEKKGGHRNVINIQTCSRASVWIQVGPYFGKNRSAIAEGLIWAQFSALFCSTSTRGRPWVATFITAVCVSISQISFQVGAADREEPHIVLMSLRNVEQKITTQRPRRLSAPLLPQAADSGESAEWNLYVTTVCVLHFAQLPKRKSLLSSSRRSRRRPLNIQIPQSIR